MNTLIHDARFAARLLLRSPGFTALVAIVLAIGIGANSAIFTLVDAALLRPLPFAQPEHLVMLWEHPPGYARNRVSPLNFLDWSEQSRVFDSMAAVVPIIATAVGGVPEMIEDNQSALLVPANDPSALSAAISRLLTDGDLAHRLTSNASALVSNRFSPEEYVRSLTEIYHQVAQRKNMAS